MDAVMLKLLVECCWIFPKIASRATEGPTVKCQVHRRLHNYHSSRSGRCVTWINPASRLAGQPGTLVQSPHLSAMAHRCGCLLMKFRVSEVYPSTVISIHRTHGGIAGDRCHPFFGNQLQTIEVDRTDEPRKYANMQTWHECQTLV